MSKFTKTVFITVFACLFLVIGIMLYKMVDMNASIETLQEQSKNSIYLEESFLQMDIFIIDKVHALAKNVNELTKKVYGIR